VYAFCRWADDLADEAGSPARALDLLRWWRSELHACFTGEPRHPVFVSLLPTIRRRGLPIEPFEQLLNAFEQDQHVTRYKTIDQLLDYCRRSADPVGRLVLRIVGCDTAEAHEFSDATCTALQLVNHWQDARWDLLERNRIYIPAEVAHRHGLSLSQWASVVGVESHATDAESCVSCPTLGPGCRAVLPAYREAMRELCRMTAERFEKGRGLWPMLPSDMRRPIMLFTLGGEAILRKIAHQGYDTMSRRPTLSTAGKAWLTARAWVGLPPGPVRLGTLDRKGPLSS
jgi:phytoene/squalene synthetase